MLCKDCQHFRITAEPIKGVDFGHAICIKHDLITDFLDHRKFKWLKCVEPPKGYKYTFRDMGKEN